MSEIHLIFFFFCQFVYIHVTRDQNQEIRMALDDIDDQNCRFEMNRVRDFQSLKQEVLGAVSRLSSDAKLQSVTVKQYFRDMTEFKSDHSAPERSQIRFRRPVNEGDLNELSQRMNDLSSAMKRLSQEGRTVNSEQMLLKALAFQSMRLRRDNIQRAHAETFGWIFTRDSEQNAPRHHYVEWLESGNGVYWISGKAGSGKSTLMKFLYTHDQTRRSLQTWAGEKDLVTAEYFFWNAGSKMQKSQEGLFRSILFELLRQCPELIPRVCQKLAQYVPYRSQPDDWTREELIAAFQKVKSEGTISARFCFFIDGMDEYQASEEGSHGELAHMLQDFSSSLDIKLCLSSRPWNEFTDAFGISGRYLRLQDLTRGDIKRYVEKNFEDSPRYQEALTRDSRYHDLVQSIAAQADGVFLWVFLVVRSLLQGLLNGDRVSDLEKRLSRIPKTLEAFFQHMLDSVDEEYAELMPMQLQYALDSTDAQSLIMLWFLDESQEDPESAFKEKMKPLSIEQLIYMEDCMTRRLQARCKGLLEVHEDPQQHRSLRYRVDFLHRTVRDYLLTPEMQKMFKNRLPENFDTHIPFCKALLAQLKTVDLKATDVVDSLIEDLMLYSAQIERDDLSQIPELYRVLDQAEPIFLKALGSKAKNAFLSIAVQRNLMLYTKDKVEKHPELLHDKKQPLLVGALHQPSKPKHEVAIINVDMVRLLFTFGADPNERCEPSRDIGPRHGATTVWTEFLLELLENTLAIENHMALFDILKMFITNGANIEQEVQVRTEYVAPRKSTGRAADLYHREISNPVFQTARDIIISAGMTADEQKRLFCASKKTTKKLPISQLVRRLSKKF